MSSVRYPPSAARALAKLKKSGNTIEIYVEDTTNPNVWIYFLRQHLPEGVNLKSVHTLGSRNAVISACRMDQADRTEKRLYIIDGDIDIALNRSKPRLKHLYRLPSYCVENMLVTEDGLVSVATASDVSITEEKASNRLSFAEFERGANRTLIPLFCVYAALISLKVPEKTVSLHGRGLYIRDNKRIQFCPKKASRRARELGRAARARCGLDAFVEETRRIRTSIINRNLSHREVVSAKDYTLAALHITLQGLFGFSGNAEQLKVHLAQRSSVRVDPALKGRFTRMMAA